jgi:hypothetical protein
VMQLASGCRRGQWTQGVYRSLHLLACVLNNLKQQQHVLVDACVLSTCSIPCRVCDTRKNLVACATSRKAGQPICLHASLTTYFNNPFRAGVMDDAPGQYSVQKLNMALARARLE